MGRVPIAQENRTNEGGDRFPRIKPKEKGEKTRFTIIEQPWREFVHYLKAPVIEDGIAVKETRKSRKDQSEYETYKLDFIRAAICLGDDTIRSENGGLDVKNCPACEASAKTGGEIPPPVQRFSANCIVYALTGSEFALARPFSATIKIWAFSGRQYDEVEGYQREIGDLRHHDITLDCVDPFFQNNKIGFKMEAGHKSAPPGYLQELLNTEGNRATDDQLQDACGTEVTRTGMLDDVGFCMRKWAQVRQAGLPNTGSGQDLTQGIDALLAETEPVSATVPAQAAVPAAAQQQDPFAGLGEFAAPTTSNPTPTALPPVQQTDPLAGVQAAKAQAQQDMAALGGDIFSNPPQPVSAAPASAPVPAIASATNTAVAAMPPTVPPSSAGAEYDDFDKLLDGIK